MSRPTSTVQKPHSHSVRVCRHRVLPIQQSQLSVVNNDPPRHRQLGCVAQVPDLQPQVRRPAGTNCTRTSFCEPPCRLAKTVLPSSRCGTPDACCLSAQNPADVSAQGASDLAPPQHGADRAGASRTSRPSGGGKLHPPSATELRSLSARAVTTEAFHSSLGRTSRMESR